MPKVVPPSLRSLVHCFTDPDFDSICCDGNIIDTRFDMYERGPREDIDLADLVCCRNQGLQGENQPPLDVGQTTRCTTGKSVPLLSMAATNFQNAQNYFIGTTNATLGTDTFLDLTLDGDPYCLGFNTAKASAMMNITVPAAQFTSMNSANSPTTTANITNGAVPSGRTASATQGSVFSRPSQTPTKSIAASPRVTARWSGLHVLGIVCIWIAILPGHST
jgi:hypothetical protein